MIRARPSAIAAFHAGLIIRAAINDGWEAPADYSPRKRARIERELEKLADKLAGAGINAKAKREKREVTKWMSGSTRKCLRKAGTGS